MSLGTSVQLHAPKYVFFFFNASHYVGKKM
mgnify:FL=1